MEQVRVVGFFDEARVGTWLDRADRARIFPGAHVPLDPGRGYRRRLSSYLWFAADRDTSQDQLE